MAGRPRRASAQRASDDVVEILDDSDEEEPQPKRRASRGRRTDPDEDDDYDPDAIEAEEDPADEDFDAEEDGGGTQAGRRKRGRPPAPPARRRSSPKRARPSAAELRAIKQEAAMEETGDDDGEGPIAVSGPALQRAENKIIGYENAAATVAASMVRGTGMTQQGVDQLVRLVVRHMIFTNSERPGVPVSRSEVTKLVSEAAGTASKRAGLPSLVIAKAQARLATSFGLEMAELTKPPTRANDKGPTAPGEGTKHFVLRSLVPPVLYASAVQPRSADAERGFLGAILSILHTADGSMPEDELWKHLNSLGVSRDATDHPKLGAPAALIDAFVRRRQLATERIQGADGPEIVYSIGENAADEVGPDRLHRFVEAEFAD